MKRAYLLALAAFVPALAYAAGGPARALFDHVPGLPADAQAAYGQWIDNEGDLKPGPAYKSLEDAIQSAQMQLMQPNLPNAQQQANAQALAAQYNTPEGRAKLQSMTPAQAMALAQQMQAQMGYTQPQPTAVSDHDQAIMRQLGIYAKTAETRQKASAIQMASVELQQKWDASRDAIGHDEEAERNRLPVCPGEAGEPSELSLRNVALKYADRRAALANSYLPKFASLLQQLKQTLAPEVDYGDNDAAQWARLQNPALKKQTQPVMQGAVSNAYGDAGTLLRFVEDISQKAAGPLADKAHIEHLYANAKGC